MVGDVEVAVLGPGDLFGEVSLLDGAPRSATVVADSDMSVTDFGRQEFVSLVGVLPKIALKLLDALATRLRAVDEGFVAGLWMI
jgi:CRP-like cAMP-binding protein